MNGPRKMKSKFPPSRIRIAIRIAALMLLTGGAPPVETLAATFVVNTTTDENNGANPNLSLREAVILANTNGETDDVILLTGGPTYVLTLAGGNENAAATGDLDILDDPGTPGADTVRIRSQGPLPAIVDGDAADRVFEVRGTGNPSLALHDLIVQNGRASLGGGGGGILVQTAGASLSMQGCIVRQNFTAATSGGGLRVVLGASATLRNCLFTGNGTIGTSNTAAIYINNTGSVLDVANCTISGNASNNRTGGIFVEGGTCTIANSTITGNSAVNDIGGIGRLGGTATVRNCIVAGNSAGTINPDVSGVFVSNGTNVIGDKTGSTSFDATDLGPVAVAAVIDTTLADNGGPTMTHLPVVAGLAENAGTNADVPAGTTADQRGGPRFVGTVDIGAVELGSVVVDTLVDENNGVGIGAGTSLREAIAAAPSGGGVLFENELFAAAPFPKQITLSQNLVVSNDVTISGPGADVLAVDGNGARRVFEISAAGPDATISGLTIRDGSVLSPGGAGVLNLGAGTVQLFDCAIVENETLGGGIGGAGLRNNDFGILRATRCLIADNNSTGGGGAARNNVGTLELIDCTLSGNTANDNLGAAGVLQIGAGQTTMIGCTVTGNTALAGSGGGLHSSGGTFTVRNCIVAGNLSAGSVNVDVQGAFTSNATNVIGDKTGSASFAGDLGPVAASAVIDTTLADNGGPTLTHALVAGGLAENAGTNADVPAASANDQRGVGFTRIIGTVDVGAYERNGVTIVPVEVSGIEID